MKTYGALMIDQIAIAFTGATAIALSQSSPRLQRYACLFGLAGQPAWIWSAWHAGQWGILALTALYTAAWAKGLWTHWIRKPKAPVLYPQALPRQYDSKVGALSGLSPLGKRNGN